MERYLYLVRHGSVEFPEGKRRCIGRTDLPLSEAGRRQARALAAYFAGHPVEAVYTSPLARTRETAVILSGNRFPVTAAGGLVELDMGEWENVPLKEIKKELESEPREGEKRADGLARFRKAIGEILDRTRGDVAVVAHAGINCCYLSSLLKSPLETSRALPQPYGGFSRILVQEPEGAVPEDGGTEIGGAEYGGLDTDRHWLRVIEPGCAPGDGGPGTAGRRMQVMELGQAPEDGRPGPAVRRMQVVELGRVPEDAPSVEECRRIWERYGTPGAVRDHCQAVERQAAGLAQALLAAGHPVDTALVQAAALLHDVARTQKDHPAAGARILVREGYPRVASVILRHHDWERGGAGADDLEAAIVCLADKQVQGTGQVSLEERFGASRSRFEQQENGTEALAAWEKRYQQARFLEEVLMKKCVWQGNMYNSSDRSARFPRDAFGAPR